MLFANDEDFAIGQWLNDAEPKISAEVKLGTDKGLGPRFTVEDLISAGLIVEDMPIARGRANKWNGELAEDNRPAGGGQPGAIRVGRGRAWTGARIDSGRLKLGRRAVWASSGSAVLVAEQVA